MIERIIVWFCDLHGPVTLVGNKREVTRHRNQFNCQRIYDKREYSHDTETDKWTEIGPVPIEISEKFVEKNADLTAEMQGISNQ